MGHVCPWWLVRSFDNPLRRRLHPPEQVFGPHLRPGMRVLDVGCGRGFTTCAMAQMVGPKGRVVAVDLQREMLEMTRARLAEAGVLDRVELVQGSASELDIDPDLRFDFILAFWMVHEVPEKARLFETLSARLAEGGALLVVEPRLHVSGRSFDRELSEAAQAGLIEALRPKVGASRAVLLRRPASTERSPE